MFRLHLVFVLAAVCVLGSGCAKKVQVDSPPSLCLGQLEVASVLSSAEQVFTEMDFRIEKLDSAVGFISTKPLEGAQFFELWRKDNADSYRGQMSNIQSLRRRVELRVSSEDGRVCISCAVFLSRLSMPEQEVTSSANAYSIYSESNRDQQSIRLSPDQREQMQWIELGRDPNLEAVILEKIRQKLQQKEDGKL